MTRKILVAEDSPTQAERVRLLLAKEGYRVDLAANGREGLERVRSSPPDLIISDVVMPEMDGYAFCQAVKTDEATKRIPFVLLTGKTSAQDILWGLTRGADNFIPKPFEDDYLLDRIQRIFEHLEMRKMGRLEVEVTLHLADKEINITADKQQIIELLFSTFDELCESNARLSEAQETIKAHAENLEAKVRERTAHLQALSRLTQKINSTLQLDEVLEFVVHSAATLLNMPYVGLFLRKDDLLELAAEHAESISKQDLQTMVVGRGVGGGVVATGEICYVEDVLKDPRWVAVDWARREGVGSFVGLPLKHGGSVLGLLSCAVRGVRSFDRNELDLMEAFSNAAAVAIHNAGTHDRLEASYEELRRSQQMIIRAEKLSALGTLAAGAAHEILNPANIIGMHAQRQIRQSAEGSAERRAAEIVWENVERISRICDGLRRFSRDEKAQAAPFVPDEAIEECLQLLAHKLRLASIKVSRRWGAGKAAVKGDRSQMVQVFLNLIRNAIDAMPGGGTLTVSTSVAGDAGARWWEARCADTGCGIPEEVMPRIFDPFYTTKPEDKGTGLGLAVSHGIVEGHGGRIWAESLPGEGATFIIRLPLMPY